MMIEEKYKVVIVDDERSAVENLVRGLSNYPEFEIKGTAFNGAKGRKMIMEQRPNLLFLDVELPDLLGFRLLSDMRDEVVWDMKVVFYTAYNKYLLQVLRESAFDCLLKPFEAEDLEIVIERYRKSLETTKPLLSFTSSVNSFMPARSTFMISTVTGFRLLHLEDIGLFEYLNEKRHWQVTLSNQCKLSLKNNTRAEDIVGYSEAFVRISQSVIININYLAMINGKQCQLCPPFNLRNDLTVSRGFMKGLQDRFYLI